MNKILFGTIGILLATIATIGVVSLAQHPEKVTDATENAAAAVQTVATDTARVFGVMPPAPPTYKAPVISEEQEQEEGDDDGDDTRTTQTPTPAPAPVTVQPTAGTYTLAQIATHNSSQSCYTAVGGSVYDLTSFVRSHPGGSGAILSLCGRDGTSAFSAQHGGQGRPANELASLKIGLLAK